MIGKIDDFRDGYVVIPKFASGSYGVTKIDRGDMTDTEWKYWQRLSALPEIKRLIKDYGRNHDDMTGLTQVIVDYLTERGVKSCVICAMRPTL